MSRVEGVAWLQSRMDVNAGPRPSTYSRPIQEVYPALIAKLWSSAVEKIVIHANYGREFEPTKQQVGAILKRAHEAWLADGAPQGARKWFSFYSLVRSWLRCHSKTIRAPIRMWLDLHIAAGATDEEMHGLYK